MHMTSRERLMAVLQGRPVDRPAVNFYEIGGFKVTPTDPDEFNIYNSPSWQPLLQLAEEKTDIIRMRKPLLRHKAHNPRNDYFKSETYRVNSSIFTRTTITIGKKTLTSLTRRDAGIDTVWHLEHFLKNVDDLKTYLLLPNEVFDYEYDVSHLVEDDTEVGDRGIVMVDIDTDAACNAFMLFSMADFTVIAMSEPSLFHQLIQKFVPSVHEMVENVAISFPGHLWRICGAEVYTEPYLPPRLFREYIVRYQKPIVDIIHKYDGFVRIHCHGKLRAVLPDIVSMGADALDPLEPPPQGDMELVDIRRDYGSDLTLFGNLEIADIENLAPVQFETVVRNSLIEGTRGQGKGFVLMPSASPYGREITTTTMANYETMVRLTSEFKLS